MKHLTNEVFDNKTNLKGKAQKGENFPSNFTMFQNKTQ